MNERDRAAADDWMRDHLPDQDEYELQDSEELDCIRDHHPDPDEFELQDSEEAGSTESYFFLRLRDSATVVYKVAVKDPAHFRICSVT